MDIIAKLIPNGEEEYFDEFLSAINDEVKTPQSAVDQLNTLSKQQIIDLYNDKQKMSDLTASDPELARLIQLIELAHSKMNK